MNEGERNRDEVLSDSEATLRQVEDVLSDIDGIDGEPGLAPAAPDEAGLHGIVRVLARTYAEIEEVIGQLRQSRGLLEQAAMDRLRTTHLSLEEVSNATEAAATQMLDGLDRALVLVDRLESDDALDDAASRGAVREELREELHGLIGRLQFQDITSQQLGYAVGVLHDLEDRMRELTRIFGVRALRMAEGGGSVAWNGTGDVHDPGASTLDAAERQALADRIFTLPRSP